MPWWRRPRAGGLRIAINRKPIRGPYGGANHVLRQIVDHFRAGGHRVTYGLDDEADCVLMYDAREAPGVVSPLPHIEAFKQRHPEIPVIHRINLSDRHKGSGDVDAFMERANKVADHTIFISDWLRDHHAQRWFNPRRPHTVIFNGADPRIFRPDASQTWQPGQPVRIVTHHWSNNWAKGFETYREIDDAIANGRLKGCELSVIGRWPPEIKWRAARTHGPTTGRSLGGLLRRHHLYVTAARFEGAGLHVVEGAQCGLPIVYHEDGGGFVSFAREIGVGYRDDVLQAIARARDHYEALRQKALALKWSGRAMCEAYEQVIRKTSRPPAPQLPETY